MDSYSRVFQRTERQRVARDDKERLRQWIAGALQRTGWNAARLAREARVSPATLSRALDAGEKFVPSTATISRIAAATGIPAPPLGGIVPGRGFGEAEVEPCTETAALPAFVEDAAHDVWRMRSRALELAGVLPGDLLMVERDRPAVGGDIVCAQVYDLQRESADTVFRLYDQPFLITRTMDPAAHRKPLLVDGQAVLIVGVAVRVLRILSPPRQ